MEKIFFKMPHINYFQPIVDGLDERFSQEGVGKKLTRLWYELRDESEYINLLKKLERNKHV